LSYVIKIRHVVNKKDHRMIQTRFLPLIGLTVLVALLGYALFQRTADPSGVVQIIDRPLPSLALPLLESDVAELDFATVQGPYVLNLFASWCLPCQVEHRVFMDQVSANGLPVYGIAYKDSYEDVTKWLDARGNPYEQVVLDLKGMAGVTLGITGVPETFLIDEKGHIRYRHVGPVRPEDWQEILMPIWQKMNS